jgi:hypothetical protein
MKHKITTKTQKAKPGFRRVAKLCGGLMTLAACLLSGNIAQAHLTYSGRDFGSYSGLTNGTATITNQAVTGNYGWADAADGILGDSHRGRAFRFHLDSAAYVSLTVAANPSATTNSIGGFTPAFSLYCDERRRCRPRWKCRLSCLAGMVGQAVSQSICHR